MLADEAQPDTPRNNFRAISDAIVYTCTSVKISARGVTGTQTFEWVAPTTPFRIAPGTHGPEYALP